MECPNCIKLIQGLHQSESQKSDLANTFSSNHHQHQQHQQHQQIQSKLDNKQQYQNIIKCGFFIRDFDRKLIQRYKCKKCSKTFSSETTQLCKYQKKRHLNEHIFTLLCSGVSQRRLSFILDVNLKTIAKKFYFMGSVALEHLNHQNHLKNKKTPEVFIFDDMETFEHTKCKPISITLAVEESSRFILGFKVSSMAAKGHLVQIALKKYGKRKDERRINRDLLLKEIKNRFSDFNGVIKSDANPHYKTEVEKYFPNAKYETTLGGRAAVVGQGELKKLKFDPLFSLNHTAAMLRANINRLFRRTWNTTKKIKSLELHIAMYVWFHNEILIQ